MTPPTPPRSRYFHLGVIYLVWGSTYFAVKLVVSSGTVSALQLQFVRAVVAAVLLAAIARVVAGAFRMPPPKHLALAALTGVLMWAGGNGFSTYAAEYASSTFIVMAMGMIPFWTIVVEAVAARTVPPRRVLIALAVGLGGLALVVGPGLVSSTIVEPSHAPLAIALLLGAGLTWAIGTAVQRRIAGSFHATWLAAVQFGAAALVLLVPTLVAGGGLPSPAQITATQWAAFGYLVLFGSVVTLSSYAVVVRSFSPAVASTFAYVNPVVGLLLGILLLGEHAEPVSIVGLVVVLGAVSVVIAPGRGAGGAATSGGPAERPGRSR